MKIGEVWLVKSIEEQKRITEENDLPFEIILSSRSDRGNLEFFHHGCPLETKGCHESFLASKQNTLAEGEFIQGVFLPIYLSISGVHPYAGF